QTSVRSLPVGTQPPLIIVYSASSVPIVQVGISSDKLSEQQLFDLSVNFIRPQMTIVPGAAIPYPYGGASVQGTDAGGRGERGECAELDPAFRKRQNRPHTVPGADERQPTSVAG